MDYELIAREFLRALRGKRSQAAFSRRIGYRTNVSYMWEAGRSFPTASVMLKVAKRTGVDVRDALIRFYRISPEWLIKVDDLTTPAFVSVLLTDLRGNRKINDVAKAIDCSRFSVTRWLHGDAQPKLPDFFRLVEGMTLRLLDFIAVFVDPDKLSSISKAWRRLESSRRAAYDRPWTHAVLRAIELDSYRALPHHQPRYYAYPDRYPPLQHLYILSENI